MIKFNLIGGPFLHHPKCSSALGRNKYVEWALDGSADISIHINEALFNNVNKSKRNYGWIFESSAVKANLIKRIKNNFRDLFNKFELIFTHDERLLNLHKNFKFAIFGARPWIQNLQIYIKTKNLSLFASSKNFCPGHRMRHQLLSKYRKHLDHFGTGFPSQLPYTIEGGKESGKILGLRDYRFSFAIENDDYPTFFTEKLTDCFATGTVPIYYGTKNIANFFDVDGIIFLKDLNIENLTESLYDSKIEHIKNNMELIKKLPTAEDYIYLNYFLKV